MQATASLQLDQRGKKNNPSPLIPQPSVARAGGWGKPCGHLGSLLGSPAPRGAFTEVRGTGGAVGTPEKRGGKGTRQQPPKQLMRGWISSIIG